MGCGATKTQANTVVETHAKSKSPEKNLTPPPPTAAVLPISHTFHQEPTPIKPNSPPKSHELISIQGSVSIAPKSEPSNLLDATKDSKQASSPQESALPHISPKKGELIEVDIASKAPAPARSAVQERLEKYAEERKMAALSRPTTANIERRLADAEERRKAQNDQKLKKVKLKNKDVEERGTQLKELEDRKAQELMLLIKNKNLQANQKRQAIQQEVKTRAEEEVVKAKEVAAKRSASQTPVDTPHSVEFDDSKKSSILEVPLPPLASGIH